MFRPAHRRKKAFGRTPDIYFSARRNTPLMKLVLRPVWAMTMLVLSACALEGAPFYFILNAHRSRAIRVCCQWQLDLPCKYAGALLDRGSIVRLLLRKYPWAKRPWIPCQVCFFGQGAIGRKLEIGAILNDLMINREPPAASVGNRPRPDATGQSGSISRPQGSTRFYRARRFARQDGDLCELNDCYG